MSNRAPVGARSPRMQKGLAVKLGSDVQNLPDARADGILGRVLQRLPTTRITELSDPHSGRRRECCFSSGCVSTPTVHAIQESLPVRQPMPS